MEAEPIRVGPIKLDVEFGIVSGAGGRYRLTDEAAKALVLLATRAGHVCNASEIAAACGAQPETPAAAEALARARISSCRAALRRVGAADMLQNVHGGGYVLRVPPGGRRLSEAQDAVLALLLESHPDRALVTQFQMAEFYRSTQQLARERADFAANGIRLDPLAGLSS